MRSAVLLLLLILLLSILATPLLAAEAVPTYTEPKVSAPDYEGTLIRLLFSLTVVILLIVLASRGLRQLSIRGLAPQKAVKVLEVQRLSPAHLVYLVEVGGRVLLLGGSQGGLTLLTELDDEEVIKLKGEEFGMGFPSKSDPWSAAMDKLRRIQRR